MRLMISVPVKHQIKDVDFGEVYVEADLRFFFGGEDLEGDDLSLGLSSIDG